MYLTYMYILLYLKLMWCNGISEIYCQLESGYMYPTVYVHSVIYDTYLV